MIATPMSTAVMIEIDRINPCSSEDPFAAAQDPSLSRMDSAESSVATNPPPRIPICSGKSVRESARKSCLINLPSI